MSTSPFWLEAEDWHTAGEPFRIVPNLPSGHSIQGSTVSDRRLAILSTPDHPVDILRRSLCREPRGHADMYGGFILPPDDEGAHLGVLFFHKDGFSTACGHGTIALGHWAITHGLVKAAADGVTSVSIDVPSGRVAARVHTRGGKITQVDFINVPSYQIATELKVSLPSSPDSEFTVETAWGGAVYAFVEASRFGLRVSEAGHDEFVKLGREIKAAPGERVRHLDHDLYGVCFFEELEDTKDALTQRNVVVFADGQIDRSPCGSGTAARVAILLAQGRLGGSKKLIHTSIINTVFHADVQNLVNGPTEFPCCIPRVTGSANLIARHSFYMDPQDPTYPGFVFR